MVCWPGFYPFWKSSSGPPGPGWLPMSCSFGSKSDTIGKNNIFPLDIPLPKARNLLPAEVARKVPRANAPGATPGDEFRMTWSAFPTAWETGPGCERASAVAGGAFVGAPPKESGSGPESTRNRFIGPYPTKRLQFGGSFGNSYCFFFFLESFFLVSLYKYPGCSGVRSLA